MSDVLCLSKSTIHNKHEVKITSWEKTGAYKLVCIDLDNKMCIDFYSIKELDEFVQKLYTAATAAKLPETLEHSEEVK